MKYLEPTSPFYRDKDIRDAYIEDDGSELPLLRFHSLDAIPGINAAFTTRYGGVSTGYLSELNLGFSRGDVPDNVWINYRRVMQRFGGSLTDVVMTHQVHKTHLVKASRELTLGDALERKVRDTDGLYTDEPGLILSATFADCVPVFLADGQGKCIALLHSGWKGTAGRIAERGVEAMCAMGSAPERITAVIGPCISGDRYEFDAQGAEVFRTVFRENECSAIITRIDAAHSLVDLPAAVWYTLVSAGVRPENIHFSGLCTVENQEHLFSHRGTGGRRGNMNAFVRICR